MMKCMRIIVSIFINIYVGCWPPPPPTITVRSTHNNNNNSAHNIITDQLCVCVCTHVFVCIVTCLYSEKRVGAL